MTARQALRTLRSVMPSAYPSGVVRLRMIMIKIPTLPLPRKRKHKR
jgi:hypothetical protein